MRSSCASMSFRAGGGRERMTSGLVALLAAVVTVSLLGQQPSAAGPAGPWVPPSPHDVAGVRVGTAVVNKARPVWSAAASAVRGPAAFTWPRAGSAVVSLATAATAARTKVGAPITQATSALRRAGSLPISVGSDLSTADRSDGLSTVSVTVADQGAAAQAGHDGVVFSLIGAGTGRARVSVDYTGFGKAFGGDYATRLRLARLPACALSTPTVAQCRTTTPVASTNNPQAGTVTGSVDLGRSPVVMLLTAGPSGDNGDYTATSLSEAGTWRVGTQMGDFTWSYPMSVPPAPGGPAPSVSLSYDSSSVDGLTGTTNNQGSWIGDGWAAWPRLHRAEIPVLQR